MLPPPIDAVGDGPDDGAYFGSTIGRMANEDPLVYDIELPTVVVGFMEEVPKEKHLE